METMADLPGNGLGEVGRKKAPLYVVTSKLHIVIKKHHIVLLNVRFLDADLPTSLLQILNSA